MDDNKVGKSRFAFIFAVSEVNVYLSMRYFGELKMTCLKF